jgi:hypothetical protein
VSNPQQAKLSPQIQTTTLSNGNTTSASKSSINGMTSNHIHRTSLANSMLPVTPTQQTAGGTMSFSFDDKSTRKISSCSAISAASLSLTNGMLASSLNVNQKSRTYIAKNKKKYKQKYERKTSSANAYPRRKSPGFFRRDSTINSKIIPFLILIKETRTAFMLFVISTVFIACYLPSILATRSLLPNDNLYIVYLYFCNSAINPIIYSFMSRNFRSELKKLFFNKSRPVFSASRFSSLNAFSISMTNKIEMKSI